ncbi:hypothetical protein CALCODRAFT_482556 [Calocera cornea HHB12733]|uniref:Mitochondrial ATP synthase epsilon chain domain-containing protein n=1 Tax=Calocera cornea HHB12733 TaxID=1353952 RepID=A0A165GJZ3_9BASI|nr:hypothetical protein CALCODRAFT_482556 [Calocera cornea HHB12733]
MSSLWRQYMTYNKYSQIAARALRAGLKEDARVQAEKRGFTALRFQEWENGQPGEQVWIDKPKDDGRAKPAV